VWAEHSATIIEKCARWERTLIENSTELYKNAAEPKDLVPTPREPLVYDVNSEDAYQRLAKFIYCLENKQEGQDYVKRLAAAMERFGTKS
jgi:hypothetical protein